MTAIIYENEVDLMTPNQARNDIMPKVPSSPTQSITLASKQVKMLKKMAIKASSSAEEEEDGNEGSSYDEKEEMNPKVIMQAKKMMKCLK